MEYKSIELTNFMEFAILKTMPVFIKRQYDLTKIVRPGRVCVIFGPRRVGKTTIVMQYLSSLPTESYAVFSGDQARTVDSFTARDERVMMEAIGTKKTVFIDEAQKIPNIGENLKLLIDTHPELSIVITGSSSFELAGQAGEPLTGRKKTILLYPLSLLELSAIHSPAELRSKIQQWLVFGSYPQVETVTGHAEKSEILSEITDSYLYKDILEFEKIKNPKKIRDLLQLLCFQIGSQVSLNELSRKLSIDVKTVARYIDLLEKSYIIYNLRGYSSNLRNEITSKSKYYFYDLGIRNALINNLNPLELRDDVGKLWENFLVMERRKFRDYTGISASDFFWRTWEQSEVDLIEQRDGTLHAYEFKWSEKKSSSSAPKQFTASYPDSSFEVITPENVLSFIAQ